MLYNNMKKEERESLIDQNILKITENTINELIKTDLEIRKAEDVWITKNLDSFYQIKLDHLNIDNKKSKIILPRTKEFELRLKIIYVNVIISSLMRIEGVVLYNKMVKKEYPIELSNKINFTKGYLVCFNKTCVNIFKNYEYNRKKINNNPIKIEYRGVGKTVLDILENRNFTNPIWIKNVPFYKIDTSYLKIYNNILNDIFDSNKITNVLNFLNKTKIQFDIEIFNTIDDIANKNKILDTSILSKNSLKNNIYQIGKDTDITLIEDDFEVENFKKVKNFINSAAVYELIKKQVKTVKNEIFYFNYLYDSRTRIYCENWPINYQLNHVIRNIIKLEKKHQIKNIYESFLSNEKIKKIIEDAKIFIIDNITIECKEKVIEYVNKKFKWKILNIEKNIEEKIKLEIFIISIKKITEKINNNNEIGIITALNLLDNFKEDNIVERIEYWSNKLKIKKIPMIVSLQKNIKNIENNIFDGIFWGDASSNAIQLITLRLGNLNKNLLMLTNIIDNKTKYSNIYEYITEEIKKLDHGEVIKKISNKLNENEINSLQNNNDNKYRVMPASYGMGSHKNFKNMEILLQDRKNTWEKLNEKEKKILADYFWTNTFKILKKIGFDLEFYKNTFKSLGDFDLYLWYSDYGLPIVPISLKTSKRQNVLEKINKLQQQEKKEENVDKKEKINEKIKKYKKKREFDDKNYWKRTMIKTKLNDKEHNIYVRIYHPQIRIDKQQTRQALVPNSIHSYDASVIATVIEICKEFDIEIVVIHDSIGCNLIYAPLIKIIFKIANIVILKNNSKNIPFPFNNDKLINEYKLTDLNKIEKLKKEILESSNMFR